MQIIPPSNEFPSKHLTICGLVTVIAGLFTFIVSCVYAEGYFIGTLICCLLMTLIAVLIILTGLYILKPLVEKVPILMGLVLLADIFAFISFCIFCYAADEFRRVNSFFKNRNTRMQFSTSGIYIGWAESQIETVLALSIISVLLLLGVLVFLTFLLYILFRNYQNNGTTTSATHTTHATHSKTVTTTTIETPPART